MARNTKIAIINFYLGMLLYSNEDFNAHTTLGFMYGSARQISVRHKTKRVINTRVNEAKWTSKTEWMFNACLPELTLEQTLSADKCQPYQKTASLTGRSNQFYKIAKM